MENNNLDDLFGDETSVESPIQDNTVTSVEDELDIPKVNINVELKYEKAEHKGDMEDYSDDIMYIRNILLKNISSADKILESLLKKIVANDEMNDMGDSNAAMKSSPRYYEVSSLLIKSICDAGKELLNLHATNLKIKNDNGTEKKNDENNGNNMNVVELIRQIHKVPQESK